MKRQSVTAIIIAVLLVFSFFIFRAYRNTGATAAASTGFSLVGNWALDSVYAPATASGSARRRATALKSEAFKTGAQFSFKTDSAVAQFAPADSLVVRYRLENDSLYIDQGTTNTAYALQKVADSTIIFRSADSLAFILRRR